MRIFSTAVIVLVAGILGSAIAQEDFLNQIRKKCEKNGGPTAFKDSNYQNSGPNLVSCVQSLVNITQFQTEIAAARLQGTQDVVLQEYCSRVPAFKNCVKNIKDSIKPCLNAEERQSVDILYESARATLQYVCEHGDVVEDFIAAGGIECVASEYSTMQYTCANRIFSVSDSVPILIPGFGIVGKLTTDREGLEQRDQFQRCSVNVLRKCENSTIANVVDDGFNFVKNIETRQKTTPENLNSLTISVKKRSIDSEIEEAARAASAAIQDELEKIDDSQLRALFDDALKGIPELQLSTASPVNVLSITAAMAMFLKFL